MTTVLSLGIVNSLSHLSVCHCQKLPVALLYQSQTSLSLALNFRNEHHEGSPEAIRGAISHIYTMATRSGAEDRWVVGVGRPACATADPLPPLWQQMRMEQGGCQGVSVTLWQRPFGWCQGLYHHITEAPYISIHQEASGGKGKWSLCLKSCSNDLWTLPPSSFLSPLTPNPIPAPSPFAFTHTLLSWQQWPFTPLPRLLHLLSIKWTGAFSPPSVIHTHTFIYIFIQTHTHSPHLKSWSI